MKKLVIATAVLILIAGCSAPVATAQPAPETNIQTAVVIESTRVALDISAKATVSAMGTQTQAAMATPTLAATVAPVFQKWSIQQAQDIITRYNLEFGTPQNMTKDDYGFAPMNAVSGIHFIIPSLCADCGGRLYEFDDPAKLQLMKKYYDSMGESSAALFSWTFAKDNILIQINGDMPEDRARQYEAALNQMQ